MKHRPGPCVLAGAVVLALALAGCSGGTGVNPPSAAAPVNPAPVNQVEQPAVEQPAVEQQRSAFPTALVGTWLRGSEGNGDRIEFAADGSFRTARYAGTATVSGSTIALRTDGQSPIVVDWSLDGGVLQLGSSTYLRDDRASRASIVGYWINTNGWTSIRFAADGSFQLDDQANGVTTLGTYRLDGNRLTLTSRTRPTAVYLVTLGDGLRFAAPDGQPIAEYTRAG